MEKKQKKIPYTHNPSPYCHSALAMYTGEPHKVLAKSRQEGSNARYRANLWWAKAPEISHARCKKAHCRVTKCDVCGENSRLQQQGRHMCLLWRHTQNQRSSGWPLAGQTKRAADSVACRATWALPPCHHTNPRTWARAHTLSCAQGCGTFPDLELLSFLGGGSL